MKKWLYTLPGFAVLCALAALFLPGQAAGAPPLPDDLVFAPMLGLLVNKANLEAVFLNLKTTFNKAFDAAPAIWQKTTMLVPSGSSQNNYNWLSRFPKMRKWLGDKVVKALAAFKYTVENEDWEATVAVNRNDIKDDNLGIYGPMAQEAGFSAKQLPDEIDADLKNNAFTNPCYDNQYFYDTDHPVGNGVEVPVASVSNKMTAVLSCTTKALALASYGTARAMIMSFKDDEGRPLALIPDVLEVGPALEAVGRTLCYSDKLDDNSPNPFKGTAELLVNPRITSTTQWMLHVTSRPIKPFVYQEREKPTFVSQTDMSSDDVFMRKEYKFGAEARAAGGYGLWQLSVGSTGQG